MKKSGVLIVFLIVLVLRLAAQTEVQGISTEDELPAPEPARGWNLHTDYSYAVINNHYEVQHLYKSGIGVGAAYRFNSWFAIEGVFTHYQRHDALSLSDIQTWTFDVNGQLSMRVAKSDLYFRTVFGLGYMDWKGYYVGPDLNDNNHYYFGKLLNDRFYTGNFGCGFSHYFFRQRLEGYIDFRLRFAGDKKVLFSISDTQFQPGLRYYIGQTKRDKQRQDEKDGDADRKPNHGKKPRVYKWVKDRKK